jgi:hypothetical protein
MHAYLQIPWLQSLYLLDDQETRTCSIKPGPDLILVLMGRLIRLEYDKVADLNALALDVVPTTEG